MTQLCPVPHRRRRSQTVVSDLPAAQGRREQAEGSSTIARATVSQWRSTATLWDPPILRTGRRNQIK